MSAISSSAAPYLESRGRLLPAVTPPRGMLTVDEAQAIDRLEEVELGDTKQWIRVRSANAANPVLLLIQQGPGLPMINEVHRFERLLGLEQMFTVVSWDQAGCGRSLRDGSGRYDISLERMVGHTVAILEVLRARFGRPTHVAGFSLGATLGAYASARRPDLVATLVAVGMDIDGAAAGTVPTTSRSTSALQRGNQRAIRQLDAIGPPPHLTPKQFATRVRWTTNFGGVTSNETYASLARELLVSLVRSPDYSPADVMRTLRGISATRAALLSELAAMDLVRDAAEPRRARRHGAGPPRPGFAERTGRAVLQRVGRAEQAAGLVRELGAHPPSRRTPEVPRAPVPNAGPPSPRAAT